MLPGEIFDLIFSFLPNDRAALKSCSAAHPLLCSFAERHLFLHVVLYIAKSRVSPLEGFFVSQLSGCLSERPYLVNYIRFVTIDGRLGIDRLSHRIFDELSKLLPLMTHSEELTLRNVRWFQFPDAFNSMLLHFLQTTHVKGICLKNSYYFPLTLLADLKNIKTLKVDSSRCSTPGDGDARYTPIWLESLSLLNINSLDSTGWANLGLSSLRSLHAKLHLFPPDLSPIFAACSKYLTTLTLEIGTLFQTKYRTGVQSSIAEPQSSFPFKLSSLESLESITIHAEMSTKTTARGAYFESNSCYSSLPAIVGLVSTSGPSLKRVVLDFDCTVGRALDLCVTMRWDQLILLRGSRPHLRVDLRIRASAGSPPQWLSSVEVVDSLIGNWVLSSLVGKGSLVIN